MRTASLDHDMPDSLDLASSFAVVGRLTGLDVPVVLVLPCCEADAT
jgi:aminoglycoside phosphotransferase (APT) family kinase protein